MFVHSKNKDHHDIEQLLKSDKVVLYACVEMLESPTLAPLWTSDTCHRISAFYIDEVHTIHELCDWWPSYGRIYKLHDVVQRIAQENGETIHIPIIVMSAICPSVYQQSVRPEP